MPIPRGQFVWHDLMTNDPEAAERFYTKVAGWGTQMWDGPMPYRMWTAGGAPLGGVMQMPPDAGTPPHWLAYVSTPDIDNTVAQAKRLGAVVHIGPQEIPNVGQFAVLSDPQGASFAIYTPSREDFASDGAPAVGEFSWHELATTDSVAALEFYTTLFGWEKRGGFDMGGGWMYQMYGRNGRELGGMFNKTAQMPGPPGWLHYIMVDDVGDAAERVKSGGGQVISGPMEVPGGDWIAQCLDPQGAMFAIHAKPKAA
jgi:predicted enzyme related to lactoylglutathione lyase